MRYFSVKEFIRREIKKSAGDVFGRIAKGDFMVYSGSRFADYSSNAAIILSKINPLKAARRIKKTLRESKGFSRYVSKIEIAAPGFLNFWLSEKGLEAGLKNLEKEKFNFGRNKKVQVEFISANPTGELHIGHGRGAFYGDVLANVLEKSGYLVEREYYINDGKESIQVKELGKTAAGKGTTYLTEYLRAKIKAQKPALEAEIRKLKKGSKNFYGELGFFLAKEIQKDNQKFIKESLGIKFDNWFSEEKEVYGKKLIDAALKILKRKKLVYQKEKAVWFKASCFGDEEDRVLVRSSGTPSYFLTDIAYHLSKVKRGYDILIDVWGADHQGHLKRMQAAKKALGWRPKLVMLISQLVTLKEGRRRKRFSKRKGDVVLLKDLLDEVGLDVLRWFFLEKSLSSHVEFDMDLAKEQSKKNPVYYVQYAHARMNSILKKSGLSLNFKFFDKSVLGEVFRTGLKNFDSTRGYERKLILKLIQFSEIIEDTSKDYQVHHLTTYAYELAKTFTDFYENASVLNAETPELRKARLGLVFLARHVLKETLSLLGISAPKKI
jgi:arginyl-tRNA synthetase